MLLYCVLQVLAGISVDTPHLFFTDVPYYLNPSLANTPPWSVDERQPVGGRTIVGIFDEASRLYSHCWTVPKSWGEPTKPQPNKIVKQMIITTDEVNYYFVESEPSSFVTRPSMDERLENKEERFVFDDGNPTSFDDSDLGSEANLENFGLPGFRAPLKSRSRSTLSPTMSPVSPTFAVSPRSPLSPMAPFSAMGPISPQSAKFSALGEVGKSDYAAPDEW